MCIELKTSFCWYHSRRILMLKIKSIFSNCAACGTVTWLFHWVNVFCSMDKLILSISVIPRIFIKLCHYVHKDVYTVLKVCTCFLQEEFWCWQLCSTSNYDFLNLCPTSTIQNGYSRVTCDLHSWLYKRNFSKHTHEKTE